MLGWQYSSTKECMQLCSSISIYLTNRNTYVFKLSSMTNMVIFNLYYHLWNSSCCFLLLQLTLLLYLVNTGGLTIQVCVYLLVEYRNTKRDFGSILQLYLPVESEHGVNKGCRKLFDVLKFYHEGFFWQVWIQWILNKGKAFKMIM